MKRMKRVLALGMAVLMCMGLTACGKDFDAAGYTKSVLDANYHAQYDKYAEYRGISESDAKKEVTEQIHLRTSIRLKDEVFQPGMKVKVHLPLPAKWYQTDEIQILNYTPG